MSKVVRCAIYTRKSTEEGLEQGFNTLDAQYEACAAYVASQKHEGWKLTKDRYDDGGFSGGNTIRPALQCLLAEVDAGRISMIVVYKIDRLTRSLADFARLVERLEAKGCSFVSVTQAFNTSTSMGRLTLNVLLSFAQFEREVAGERIRDKIAASKKRGLWMGGTLPLGYDRHPDPREQVLVVNEAEAAAVQQIFDLYEQTGCLRRLTEEVARRDLRSKPRTARDGREIGNRSFGRGQLHYLLTNPVYRGRTRHGRTDHNGRHPAIIGEDQWQRVQQMLQQKAGRGRGDQGLHAGAAPLTGKLVDEMGDRLTPTHTAKGSRLYRYYVSNRMISAPPDPAGWRLPAATLEAQIAGAVRGHLARAIDGHQLLARPDLSRHDPLAEKLDALVAPDATTDVVRRRRLLILVESGTLDREMTTLQLSRPRLAALLGVELTEIADAILSITAPTRIRRRGVEARLVIGERPRQPDPKLVAALVRAHRWLDAIRAGRDIASLAKADGVSEGCLRVHLQLALLAPTIQAAILDGTQPEGLTLHRLTRPEMPSDWHAQYRRTGIGPA
ncbi:recombinase family protein [Paracoccus tibetensis]|uniref:Site-specific DNA recombinase n=1 Tax=Paracoccus tibetensis TaxID=336292 RepID=A0A1G5J586_9RHOB|nr:recombinase family protein [Paracoccus tibetensis]SCY83121.1 Site-specific DNA recombinase [Paracoccus tibetensis]